MNKLTSHVTGAILSALSLSGCSSELPPEPLPIIDPYINGVTLPIEIPLTEISEESVANSNEFALKFLAESLKDDNICLSPLSVASVLGMLANGDDGETRDEVLTLLGFQSGEKGVTELNRYNNILLSNLPELDEYVMCHFSNSVWHAPEIEIKTAFSEITSKNFGAQSIPIDPSGESGMGEINYFVEYNTNGLIKNFLDNPLTERLAFLNTLYFKGSWTDSFDKDLTKPEKFINLDGSSVKTDFMHSTSSYEYAMSSGGTEAIRLPYGNGDFRMTLILPSEKYGKESLKHILENGEVDELSKYFSYRRVSLSMPKFKTESKDSKTLDVLRKMGLDKACNPNYGFHNITGDPCFLNTFIHAAKIIVDEDGTEGGAASIVGIYGASGQLPPEPYKISFNRPFLFMIDERSSGAILFIGAVTNFK